VHLVPPPDVVGLSEIATLLGSGKSYARDIASSKGFPEGTKLAMGWVWNRAEVVEYIARRWPDKAR
jgi:predicted DNA-binding transcriptional regulator AlpA